MDWNRAVLIAGQALVVCVLGGLVATGHDSYITDTLMVVCGSLAGTGVYSAVKSQVTK
jgi:hypothetical protein